MNNEDTQNQLLSWAERGPEASATLADMEALQEWTAVEIAGNKRRISGLEWEVKTLKSIIKSKILIKKNIHAKHVLEAMESYDREYLDELLELLTELNEIDD